ncbi:MAG: putative rane protein [Candidatus Saccharibacteria bacterium]|nr:putative rane protein [Candidatus Saccharibacteria bacterium]
MLHKISRRELVQAQMGLFIAIALQVIVSRLNHELLVGPQSFIIPIEIILAILIGFTVNRRRSHERGLHHTFALTLLALISVANISSLVLVLNSLVVSHASVSGLELLSSAIAIFMTNIIVYALWYWEIDSPGMTRKRWSKEDKDFQFTQQDMKDEFPDWQPAFLDYLYLSVTNAINFAAADARPLTHASKLLMASQALISVFTLALVVARSVSILGT